MLPVPLNDLSKSPTDLSAALFEFSKTSGCLDDHLVAHEGFMGVNGGKLGAKTY